MARAATIADKLKAAHEAVLADLRELDTSSGARALPYAHRLHAHLVDARKHLRKQFAFEEKDGYMQVARERNPNREHTIEALRLEHRIFEKELDGMIDEAARMMAAEQVLRMRVRDWIGQVRRHEAAENDLIQDVFSLDVAAED
jgi:hypothetical protein